MAIIQFTVFMIALAAASTAVLINDISSNDNCLSYTMTREACPTYGESRSNNKDALRLSRHNNVGSATFCHPLTSVTTAINSTDNAKHNFQSQTVVASTLRLTPIRSCRNHVASGPPNILWIQLFIWLGVPAIFLLYAICDFYGLLTPPYPEDLQLVLEAGWLLWAKKSFTL